MKKILLETSFSKIYIIVMILISVLLLGGYFSYAMFTVSKERNNAISIITGNLTYKLEVDGKEDNELVVESNSSKEFIVTLSNPNNRVARFNFYYLGETFNDINIGYFESSFYNKTPESTGINLEKSGTSGSSNIYRIIIENKSSSEVTINLGVSVGLDYNDLELPDNAHLFTKIKVSEPLEQLLSNNKLQTDKNNMFNYTSDGNILADTSNGTIENDPNYVTDGLYNIEDEDGISYYFRGNINNNYVQFGEYSNDYYVYVYNDMYFQSIASCQERFPSCNVNNSIKEKIASVGDKMYWRIIRLNGDGSLRLIYAGNDLNSLTNIVGIIPYNYNYNDPKYTGYTYDRDTNETDSFIKKEVDTWYKNTLSSSDYDNLVINGRFCSDSSGYKSADEYGFVGFEDINLFSIYERLGMANSSFSKPNSPTLICPVTAETYGGSYRLKVGLITADELALAGEGMMIEGNSYLNLKNTNTFYWSMTPSDYNITGKAYVRIQNVYIDRTMVSNPFGVRPVINVNVDNGFSSGDGTLENPYIISLT